jgi:hypothetical protein
MKDFYWSLILYDGEEIKVRPENVTFIQDKLATFEGFIKTPSRSIAVKSVKDFVETSERFIDQKLLEDGARAFGYPVIENDSVMCRWVKKPVTKREYNKYYAVMPAYWRLEEKDNYMVISWKQPLHLINPERMEELSPDDELNLSRFKG